LRLVRPPAEENLRNGWKWQIKGLQDKPAPTTSWWMDFRGCENTGFPIGVGNDMPIL